MLQSLRIRNLVIIEDLSLDFAPGLNLLTGETGTGKSIVVDAIGLVAGKRADRSMIRSGAASAIVEALFRVDPESPAGRWIEQASIVEPLDDGQLIVRREVSASGGTIRINGSPVTLSILSELGARLLELHGQHETRSLLVPERHLAVLDRFGGLEGLLDRVGGAHRAYVRALDDLGELDNEARDRQRRVAELQAIVREIDAVGPKPGETAELDRERSLLRNVETVAELVREIVGLTYDGDPTAASLAAVAARAAGRLAEIDPQMEEIATRLRSAAVEIQEAGATTRDYGAGQQFEPGRLERLESRRAALQRLLLRFGENEEAVIHARAAAARELEQLDGHEELLRRATERLRQTEQAYARCATDLGRRRRKTARSLGPSVEQQLGPLALGKASFSVHLAPALGEPLQVEGHDPLVFHPRGAERAEFRLAANPGEPARALNKVASGGELSRVMLGLHAAVDGAGEDRVLIFDEIDTGVGGRVADAVGARLAGLARSGQVLCVTHLPQVAAYADRHFSVRKWVEGDRTHTAVDWLENEQRIEELARMLGGKQATEVSRRHAAEMLEGAERSSAPQPPRRQA